MKNDELQLRPAAQGHSETPAASTGWHCLTLVRTVVPVLFAFLLHAYICCLYVAFQSSNSLQAELSPFYLKHAGCVGRCIVTGTDKVMKNSRGRLDWLMAACIIYEQVSNELVRFICEI